jgi:hypothetical protein
VHYITLIYWSLSEWRAFDGLESDRMLIMHVDNARPHTTRLSVEFFEYDPMRTAPHPPHSPDIAPSDGYLFGHVKGSLAGSSLADAAELFEVFGRVIDCIEKF